MGIFVQAIGARRARSFVGSWLLHVEGLCKWFIAAWNSIASEESNKKGSQCYLCSNCDRPGSMQQVEWSVHKRQTRRRSSPVDQLTAQGMKNAVLALI